MNEFIQSIRSHGIRWKKRAVCQQATEDCVSQLDKLQEVYHTATKNTEEIINMCNTYTKRYRTYTVKKVATAQITKTHL
jgi:hypothetical protein